ncbi:DUF302 domain-containing protein [Paracoccus luteus]|uniref:DUF302 domain-containing protein n=1 Tax=Paracoccus luteus TaxID=2508543 RepID=UPI00106FC13D|nr:DUF302 domain-containing protein [Paracoccus luteus]
MTPIPTLARLALAAALALPAAAAAQAPVSVPAYAKTVEAPFEDATFAVEQAITNAGLVIDSTSQVGDMLARTKADVGGTKDLYAAADAYTFCSAAVSRQVMEADVTNIQFCPYSIFVYETVDQPGQVTVGHRIYPGETMQPVNDMLSRIVDDATAN